VTQEKIDGLREAYNALDTMRLAYETVRKHLQKDVDTRLAECDHKNPDSTSAVESGFIEDVCLICNLSV
jgi:hypothetical protein